MADSAVYSEASPNFHHIRRLCAAASTVATVIHFTVGRALRAAREVWSTMRRELYMQMHARSSSPNRNKSVGRVPCVLVVAASMAAGCGRDPGREVVPLSDPLGASASKPAATEILPLDKVPKSQAAAVSQRIANTEVTITYSRPVARGRALFGELVPYGKVWNPGADQATAVAVTRDVHVDGQPLSAGKYSLWAIPAADMWTVIFSKVGNVYHTDYPGEAQDALRIAVQPERGPHMEVLTFYFPDVEGKDAVLRLHWGETMVPLSLRVP